MAQPVGPTSGPAWDNYVAAQAQYDAALAKVHTPEVQQAMSGGSIGSTAAEVLCDRAAEALKVAEKAAGYGYNRDTKSDKK